MELLVFAIMFIIINIGLLVFAHKMLGSYTSNNKLHIEQIDIKDLECMRKVLSKQGVF